MENIKNTAMTMTTQFLKTYITLYLSLTSESEKDMSMLTPVLPAEDSLTTGLVAENCIKWFRIKHSSRIR